MSRLRQYINHARVSRFRFYFQIVAFAVLIYGGLKAINIGDQLPTFSCVFTDTRGGACYLMGLQHQMSMPFSRLFGGAGIGVLVGLGTFVGGFLLLNKSWCGFVCPLGTIQDWLTKVRKRLKIRYSVYNSNTFRRLKSIKYILLVLLLLIPMAIGNSLFGLPKLNHDFGVPFCMICPGRTLLPVFSGDFSQLAIDFSSRTKMIFTALGMAVTGIFLSGAFVKKRFICLFCPMSALQYVFAKLGFLRLLKDGSKCTRCGNCYRACDVGLHAIADDVQSRNILQDDCMMCLKCIEACPEDGCLKATFLGLPVYEATAEGFYKREQGKANADGL